jgi:hypothetical protein
MINNSIQAEIKNTYVQYFDNLLWGIVSSYQANVYLYYSFFANLFNNMYRNAFAVLSYLFYNFWSVNVSVLLH